MSKPPIVPETPPAVLATVTGVRLSDLRRYSEVAQSFVTLRLPETMVWTIDKIAKQFPGLSRTGLIRFILERAVADLERNLDAELAKEAEVAQKRKATIEARRRRRKIGEGRQK